MHSHLADVTELCHQGQRAGGIGARLSWGAGWMQTPGRSRRGWQGGWQGGQPPSARRAGAHLLSTGHSSGGSRRRRHRGLRSAPRRAKAWLISCTVGHQGSPAGEGTVRADRALGDTAAKQLCAHPALTPDAQPDLPQRLGSVGRVRAEGHQLPKQRRGDRSGTAGGGGNLLRWWLTWKSQRRTGSGQVGTQR